MGFFESIFKSLKLGAQGDYNKSDEIKNSAENFKEEYSEPISPDEYRININDSYSSNGVHLEESGSGFKVVYDGLLAKSGAQEIYTVVGYGNNIKWEDTASYTMQKTGDQKFELFLPVNRDGNINIAFRDAGDNWDNNSGMNYSFIQ